MSSGSTKRRPVRYVYVVSQLALLESILRGASSRQAVCGNTLCIIAGVAMHFASTAGESAAGFATVMR